MSTALRVLAVTLVGWVGFRAMTFGLLPGAELFTLGSAPAEAAPAQPSFPPLEPPVSYAQQSYVPAAPAPQPVSYVPMQIPLYYPVPRPAYYQNRAAPPHYVSVPQPIYLAAAAPLPNEWALSRFATNALPPPAENLPVPPVSPTFTQRRPDRFQLATWALIRGRQGVTVAPGSLAPGGTLGGSQAGARLIYVVTPQVAASLRATSPVGGGSGGEVAAGIRYTPFRSIPIAITAERRKAIGEYGGGRDAFAMFVEGGVYQQPMWGMELDGYGQAGIVGARERDWFADGGFTLTRPLFREFSGGLGVWGGFQPGLHRVDAGPRVSMRLRNNMRVHLDWRQRVSGNALPRSGPAITLAGDF